MARSEARLSVEIWSDPDFLALSPSAQRMFMFLLSQPDLAHTGVLALRERRWARGARGLNVDLVQADLCELAQARFVVVDEDAEELLIRSFIRRDKVYRQPNVLRAAADHLPLIESPAIRLALAVELERISMEEMAEGSQAIVAEMRKALPNPSDNPPPNPSGNHAPGTPGERGVVTAVSSVSPFPVPRAVPPPAGVASRDDAPSAQTLVADWLDRCRKRPPGNVIAQVGKSIKAMLGEGIDPADIRAGVEHWQAKGLHPSALSSVVNELMNGGPARASPRPSTTDARVAAALALADELRDEERREIT